MKYKVFSAVLFYPNYGLFVNSKILFLLVVLGSIFFLPFLFSLCRQYSFVWKKKEGEEFAHRHL